MKLTIARSALADALARVGRIVKAKQIIPILSNVLLRAEGAAVDIVGTNLDIQITVRVEGVTVEESGSITLPAQTLTDIARKVADGDVSMALDGLVMAVRSGRSRFRVPTIPATDFPDIGAVVDPVTLTVPGPAMARLLGKTEFAMIGPGTERPYLQGVFLHGLDGRLTSCATNGHQLATVSVDGIDAVKFLEGITVPGPAVAEIIRLAGEDPMDVSIVPGAKIMVGVGSTTLVSKLLDSTFPDYERVIPTANSRKAVVERDELVACLDRAMIAIEGRGRMMRLDFRDDRLTATAVNGATGMEGADEIRIEHEGEFAIGVNGSYLREIAGQIDGDTMEMALEDAGSPILIRDPASAGARFVLMPMRL